LTHETSGTERAEFAVLAAIFEGDEPLMEAIEVLKPSDFGWRQNRLVFEAAQGLFEKGAPVDPVTLLEELRVRGNLEDIGGPGYVADLIGGVPHGENIAYHCQMVREASSRRALASVCQRALNELGEDGSGTVEEVLERAEKGIFDITHNVTSGKPELLTSFLGDSVKKVEERKKSGKEIFGVQSGFKFLDHMLGGFHNGELYVLAARPSMGKTALVTNIVDHIGVTMELSALMFSLEMSKEDIGFRLLSLRTGVPANFFRTPKFIRDDDFLSVHRQLKLISESQIYLDDQPGANVLAMRAKARRAMVQHRYKILVIDYLQLMHGPSRSSNRNEEIGYISRGLKALARELNVPVLALSQLSRGPEARPDRRPLLSDLRESGAIEQDADAVMFLYRPEYYFGPEKDGVDLRGKTELIVAKNRNGPTGTINMVFRDQTMKFYETHKDY
jgi:replicative DNA helicase